MYYYRTYFSQLAVPFYIMLIISNCIVHSVLATQKLKKYLIRVNIAIS